MLKSKKTFFFSLLLILFLILFLFFFSFHLNRIPIVSKTITVFQNDHDASIATVPSGITDTKGDIRIGVEKSVQEKYFILYSFMTGDQSNFTLYLIIENKKGELLPENPAISVFLMDQKGTVYESSPAYALNPYPEDEPLGWKQILIVKFEPLPKDVAAVDVFLDYDGKQFLLKDVLVP